MRGWFPFARRPALLVWACLFCLPAWSQKSPKPVAKDTSKPDSATQVVITVDDHKLTVADVDQFVESLPPQYRSYYSGPGRKYLPIYLVRMQVLLGEAQKEKLQDQPEVKQAIEIARDSILSNAAQQQLEKKIDVTDQEVEDLYKKEEPQLEEARIRRIILHTDASSLSLPNGSAHPPMPFKAAWKKLEDLRKQILAGADFAKLAKENSDDPQAATSGGDMGYINRQQVVPPVANVAFSLKPGQVSDVIQTPYGLELIQLEDRREKPLAEMRPQLEKEIRQEKVNQEIQHLIEQHTVVIDKKYFAPE